MATSTTKRKSVFGLAASALSNFIMGDSGFSDAGQISMSVARAGVCAQMKDVSTKLAGKGVDARMEAAGMGFLKIRKSEDKGVSLFDDLVKLATGSASEYDTWGITQNFPRIVQLLNHTSSDKTRKVPITVPPIIRVYDYPIKSAVNELEPGKVMRVFVLAFLDFQGVENDLYESCSRARAFSVLSSGGTNGRKWDATFLSPRVVLAKVSFQFVDPASELAIDPTWFFDKEEQPAPASGTTPQPPPATQANWTLVKSHPGTKVETLPDFAASELDLDTWKQRILVLTGKQIAESYKTNYLFGGETTEGLDTAQTTKAMETCTANRQDFFEAASLVFKDQAAIIKPGDIQAAKAVYIQARHRNAGKVISLPRVNDSISDGNIIAR